MLVGIATIGRLWCSLYISGYKNTHLITSGPYSISRNPLYFFSMVGFAGVGLSTETLTFAIALLLLALMFYPAVIAREERYLREKFPADFEFYAARVPRLIPKFTTFSEPQQYIVNPALFRRAMGDVIWFVAVVGVIEFVEALHEYHVIKPLIHLP